MFSKIIFVLTDTKWEGGITAGKCGPWPSLVHTPPPPSFLPSSPSLVSPLHITFRFSGNCAIGVARVPFATVQSVTHSSHYFPLIEFSPLILMLHEYLTQGLTAQHTATKWSFQNVWATNDPVTKWSDRLSLRRVHESGVLRFAAFVVQFYDGLTH